MVIEKKPFVNYSLGDRDNNRFVLRLNEEDTKTLNDIMFILQQPKPITAIKQCFRYGAKGILSPQTKQLLDTLFKNKRNNQRSGRMDFE